MWARWVQRARQQPTTQEAVERYMGQMGAQGYTTTYNTHTDREVCRLDSHRGLGNHQPYRKRGRSVGKMAYRAIQLPKTAKVTLQPVIVFYCPVDCVGSSQDETGKDREVCRLEECRGPDNRQQHRKKWKSVGQKSAEDQTTNNTGRDRSVDLMVAEGQTTDNNTGRDRCVCSLNRQRARQPPPIQKRQKGPWARWVSRARQLTTHENTDRSGGQIQQISVDGQTTTNNARRQSENGKVSKLPSQLVSK